MKLLASILVLGSMVGATPALAANAQYTCDKAPSTISMPVESNAVFHSVQWWNNTQKLTNRTLDRSICKDIDRIWTSPTPLGVFYTAEQIGSNKRMAMRAVATPCQKHLEAKGVANSVQECGAGWSSIVLDN